MARVIHREQEQVLSDKKTFLNKFYSLKSNIFLLFVFLPFSLLISVKFTLFIFLLIGLLVWKFHAKFFPNESSKLLYANEFAPYCTDGFVSVGYKIEYDKFLEHVSIVNDPNALREKQEKYRNRKNDHVVLSLADMKEHYILPAKTGGGKTSLMKTIIDRLAHVGAGGIFVDGKADLDMYLEFADILAERRRESDLFVINFNAPNKDADSHTMQPAEGMHPSVAVEFFSELGGRSESTDGNSQHFVNRGKVMLFPIYSFVYLRKMFYDMNFEVPDLELLTDVKEINIMQCVAYGILKDINNIIENNSKLLKKAHSMRGAKLITYSYLAEVELLIEYVKKNSIEKFEIESELGISLVLLKEMYAYVFKTMQGYTTSVRSVWASELEVLFKYIYTVMKDNGRSFLPGEDFVTTSDVRELYNQIKIDSPIQRSEISRKAGVPDVVVEKIFGEELSLENMPSDAVQQHSYAQQQYNYVFQIFKQFDHIFGEGRSEVEIMDIIDNNQFLFTLLPTMPLNKSIIQALSKIIISAIKRAAERAIGGENLNLSATQKEILRVTTKPFLIFEIFLDEYYAYATEDVAKFTTQLRSLDMGMIISLQAFDGLKPTEQSNQEKAMLLANTQKYVLEVEDQEVIEYAEKNLRKKPMQRTKKMLDSKKREIETNEIDIQEDYPFNPNNLKMFRNGLSGIIKKGNIYLVQNWFTKYSSKSNYLKRYRKMKI